MGYRAFQTHPEVARTSGQPPMDEEKVSRYLSTRATAKGDERGNWQGYAVVQREDGRLIGEVGLYLQTEPEDEGDLGFIVHPDAQRNGYATEAATTLMRHGFTTLGLRRITAHCDVDNVASARTIERLGLRRVAAEDGKLAYALDRNEWLA